MYSIDISQNPVNNKIDRQQKRCRSQNPSAPLIASTLKPLISPDMSLIQIPVFINEHILQAELATESNERKIGLMHRSNLAPNSAMLFVHDEPSILAFWMKNTYFPISLAFINDHLHIVHIVDMEPQTTRMHQSPYPVRYALEANRSWFKTRGISVGSAVHFDLPC